MGGVKVMDALGGGVRGQFRINRAASSAAAASAAVPQAHAGSSGAGGVPRQAGGPRPGSISSNAPSAGVSSRPQPPRPTGAAPLIFPPVGGFEGSPLPSLQTCLQPEVGHAGPGERQ